jgi:hypothetical protein
VRSPLRRLAAALSVTTLLAAGAVTAALPATASPQTASAAACTTSLDLPGRLSLDRPLQQVRIAANDRCGIDRVTFEIRGGLAGPASFYFDLTESKYARWDVPGTAAPGVYTAYSGTPGYVPTSSIVKYGSKISFRADRILDEPALDPDYVTAEACAAYYNGSRSTYLPWRDHRIVLENTDAQGRFRYLTTVRTGADGCAVVYFPNKYSGTYRATSYETGKIFSRTSQPEFVGGLYGA